MALLGSELQFFELANLPNSLSANAGGAITGTQITDLSVGMLFTGIQGLASGIVDTNNVVFYPSLALVNTDSSATANNVGIAILNGIPQTLAAAGIATFLPSSSADAGLIVETWGIVSGGSVIVSEQVTLGNLVATSGAFNWARIERQIVRSPSGGNPITVLVGNLACSRGADAWRIGALGSYATREILAYPALSTGTVSVYAVNTDPTSGATFFLPTLAAPLYLTNSSSNAITHGVGGVIYFKFNIQPTMPAVPVANPIWPECQVLANG